MANIVVAMYRSADTIKYCTTMLTKTNNQKKECKTAGDIGA